MEGVWAGTAAAFGLSLRLRPHSQSNPANPVIRSKTNPILSVLAESGRAARVGAQSEPMSDSPLVNFLIAGVQKGGTTALASFLAQHPEVCLAPKKEVHFFDSEKYLERAGRGELEASYRRAFPNYTGQPVVGEATPIYLFQPELLERVREYNPGIKLICLLRDPVARAVSHYRMERGRGEETLPFPLALLLEPWRLRKSSALPFPDLALRRFSYFGRGCYSRQIQSARRLFPEDQLLFLRTDDLWEKHGETLRTVYRFLGIGNLDFIPERARVFSGEGRRPVSPIWKWFLRRAYRGEVGRTEALLGWDLSAWK